MEFYNVTVEEEGGDPRKINILDIEGYREVEGPQLEIPNITEPLKTGQVNIGMEAKAKFCKDWGLLGLCASYY